MAPNDNINGHIILLHAPPLAGVAERCKWDILSRKVSNDVQVAEMVLQSDAIHGQGHSAAPTNAPDRGDAEVTSDGVASTAATSMPSPQSVTSTLVESLADVSLSADKLDTVSEAYTDYPSLLLTPSRIDESISRGTYVATHPHPQAFAGAVSHGRSELSYTMCLQIVQDVPRNPGAAHRRAPITSNFHLVADTGSNTTWIIGHQCQGMEDANSDTVRDWSYIAEYYNAAIPPRYEGIFNHAYRYREASGDASAGWFLDDDALTGKVKYLDTTRALLALTKTPVNVTLPESYSFDARSWETPLTFQLSFGVAYAMTRALYRRNTHGVLGLGTATYQNRFNGSRDRLPSTFGTALNEGPVRHVLPRAGTGEGGLDSLIYYLMLRKSLAQGDSVLGINQWPCVNEIGDSVVPDWSAKIPLAKDAGRHWSVTVLSLDFEYWGKTGKDGENDWYHVKGSHYPLGDGGNGITVTLDTGSSVSWLPAGLVRHIRLNVFSSVSENRKIDAEQGDRGTPLTMESPPYIGPHSDRVNLWRVIITFKGAGSSKVSVKLPLDPFVCTENPIQRDKMEGLLCIPTWTNGQYLLGMNFFQAAFVALHNVAPGFPDRAYVRVAPQWPGERSKYCTPPMF